MPLSDTTIRNVKPGDHRKRLSDGNSLYLLLCPDTGAHRWRFDYTFEGRRKTISLGVYPDTSLKLAREKLADARRLVAAGIDPSQKRKDDKANQKFRKQADERIREGLPALGSFEEVATKWFADHRTNWSLSYGDKIIQRLKRDVFPYIGRRPIAELTPPELLEVLKLIESRGALETAHRARENCSQVFRYAIASGNTTRDPCRDLKDALRKPHPKHMAAITDPAKLVDLLRAIEGYRGTPIVRAAVRLAPILMLRPGELRRAEWSEFNLEMATWTIPARRMKGSLDRKREAPPHIVPLPTQAIAILSELQPLTGVGKYVFPGQRHHDRPMSENTVNAAIRALGYDTQEQQTGHGFRATARTIVAEHLKVNPAVIEAQLAHSKKGSLGNAYDRAEYLEERREMMQRWADYLEQLRLHGHMESSIGKSESGQQRHAAQTALEKANVIIAEHEPINLPNKQISRTTRLRA